MLQEVSIHNGQEDAKIIAKILGKEYTYFQATAQKLKTIPQANALVWNKKNIIIDTLDILELPPLHKGSRLQFHYKKIFDKEHRLAVLMKSVLQKRISLLVEGEIHKKTFRIYVVHFDIIGFSTKRRQMDFVLQHAKYRKNVDIEIIAGDINTFKYFNMPQWTSIQALTKKAGFIDLTSDIKWTFTDKRIATHYFARHKLDAIFIRHRTNKSQLNHFAWSLDIPGSDHIPIFANIVLP